MAGRRLSSFASAVAFASSQLTPAPRFEPSAAPTSVQDHQRFQRCFCPACHIADRSERWGYFQFKLPL